MLKVQIRYDSLTGQEDIGIEVIVYNSYPSKDGTHISASSVFHAGMLKGLSKKKIDSLINSLIPSLEACNKEVERRIKLEGNHCGCKFGGKM